MNDADRCFFFVSVSSSWFNCFGLIIVGLIIVGLIIVVEIIVVEIVIVELVFVFYFAG